MEERRQRRSGRLPIRLAARAATALGGLLLAGAPAVAQTGATFLIDGVPYTSAACAAEWGTCYFEGTRRIAYGIPGKWLYRYATGS